MDCSARQLLRDESAAIGLDGIKRRRKAQPDVEPLGIERF